MYWNPFKKLEELIMATREDLGLAITESNKAITALANAVSKESEDVRTAIGVLEAKILQGQYDGSAPVDYSAEIEAIKSSVNALQSITQSVDAIYSEPAISPVDVPVVS